MKKHKILYILLALILVVNIVNLCFNLKSDKTEAKPDYEALNEIKIGVSKAYIDELIGTPLTEETGELFSHKDKGEIFTTADYKYGTSAVLCLFEKESLVAFAIVVEDTKTYKVTYKYFLEADTYLKDFTYTDFCEYAYDYAGNVPASDLFSAYYYEIYDGSGATGNIASFLATYVHIDDNNILHIGQDSSHQNLESKGKMTDELKQARAKAKPNVYGEIHPDYVKDFNFPGDLLTYNAGRILF